MENVYSKTGQIVQTEGWMLAAIPVLTPLLADSVLDVTVSGGTTVHAVEAYGPVGVSVELLAWASRNTTEDCVNVVEPGALAITRGR